MWVKICGNTRLEDCLLASELGADAVGFVFAEGKRTVHAEQVAAITSRLPETVEKIGVFTTVDASTIVPAALAAGLTGVQLHNNYDPALVRALRAGLSGSRCVRLLQVVHWDLDLPAETQLAAFTAEVQRITSDGLVDALLVDSRTAQKSGGTGQAFDWKAAAPALAASGIPIVIAGGLNAHNVADAIATLQPWAVDVSSGVERAPGVKNGEALRCFLESAKRDRF